VHVVSLGNQQPKVELKCDRSWWLNLGDLPAGAM